VEWGARVRGHIGQRSLSVYLFFSRTSPDFCPYDRGSQVLDLFAMDDDAVSFGAHVAILLSLIFGYRLIAWLVLHRRANAHKYRIS
jgi:hypothetical protein